MPRWFDADHLFQCWLKVKEKGSQGGIDNRTIDDYKMHLRRKLNKLSARLKAGEYIPEPGKQIKLKKSDGGFRTINMTTIEDKIVQTAVKREIEPIFEKDFLPCSYAYRPGKGHRKAIRQIEQLLNQNFHWIALGDIDNFFDTIDHNLLLNMLGQKIPDQYLLHLIQMWLKIGAFSADRYQEKNQGVPQGGVISTILSNIYLHPFDLALKNQGAHYLRYADDFILLEKNKEKATTHLSFCINFLQQKLRLSLNPSLEPVFHQSKGFVFLGIRFQNTRKTIAPAKVKKALNKIEKISAMAPQFPFSETINRLNEAIASWQYYYGECDHLKDFTIIQNKIFIKLSEYIRLTTRKGRLPKYGYLQGNLNRLKLLIPLSKQQKHSIFKQILSGQKLNAQFLNKLLFHSKTQKMELPKTSVLKDKKYSENLLSSEKIKRAVSVKKRKYQRRFASEYDLVLSGHGIFVGKHSKRLVVKNRPAGEKEFAISKIKHILVLSASVTFSSAAIFLCSKHNIPIDFLDYQGKPFARLTSPEQPAWRFGIYQTEALKNAKGYFLARKFIEGKIRNQTNLMKYFSKYRKKRDKEFMEMFSKEITLLTGYIDEINQLNKNLSLEKGRQLILGIEGRAGAAYWRLVRKLIEDKVEFKKRERYGAKDLVNSMLNYGYGILYARVWGAIMVAGLDAQISFLHCSQRQKPTLVYDIIEEFRAQVVDRVVISLITRGEKMKLNDKGYLTKESKEKLIENIFERLNTPVKFRKKQCSLQEIIQFQARAIGNYLKEGRPVYRPFIAKW